MTLSITVVACPIGSQFGRKLYDEQRQPVAMETTRGERGTPFQYDI